MVSEDILTRSVQHTALFCQERKARRKAQKYRLSLQLFVKVFR